MTPRKSSAADRMKAVKTAPKRKRKKLAEPDAVTKARLAMREKLRAFFASEIKTLD